MKKITVVGAGNVGATAAHHIVARQLGSVCLIDIADGLAAGKALDIMQSAAVDGFGTPITGSSDYAHAADSDVVLITAGIARKPGMSRDDLLKTNATIIRDIATQCLNYAPNAIFIVVTNPLDVMTWLVADIVQDHKRVMGMAGVLDASRYAQFIAEALDCSIQDVRAMVLGGHGDTMVPLPRYSSVNGISITELLPADKIEKINARTQSGGAEIVKLLKTGSAYYAPASSAVSMVEAVLLNTNRILPACVYVDGAYGLTQTYCGVPVQLDETGVAKIITLDLSDDEQAAVLRSAAAVKEIYKSL